MTLKVMSVVGARPQFVKLAPIDHAFADAGIDHVIVHTGQHYDPLLSTSFFEELKINSPDYHLNVGSGPHGEQTGRMLIDLEPVMIKEDPDWVLVYGDTNSTLAAAVCAGKLGLPTAHLEAGLRSFNRSMPEEHNRVLTDHSADLLLAPTEVGVRHLADEGLAARTVLVGDVMTDVLYQTRDAVAELPLPLAAMEENEGEYFVATLHRPQNTDDPDRLAAALQALEDLDSPVFLLAHPRLRSVAEGLGLTAQVAGSNLHWCDPLPYPQLVRAVMGARGVITDSGGLQKEAFLLRIPCTTVRTETEWTETVDLGWNVLVAPGPKMADAALRPTPAPTTATPYGDGHAAQRVAQTLRAAAIEGTDIQ